MSDKKRDTADAIPVEFITKMRSELLDKAKIGGMEGRDYGTAAATLAWLVGLYRIANAKEINESQNDQYETDIRADGSVLIRPKM